MIFNNFIFPSWRAIGARGTRRQRLVRQTDGPFRVPLTGGEHTFACLADLDFALAARTSVPLARLQMLGESSIEALEGEDIALRTLELQFGGFVEDYDRHGIGVSATLRRTGVAMISKDHDWRALFTAVLGFDAHQQSLARLILARYVEYLAERRSAIATLLTLKRGAAVIDAAHGGDDSLPLTAPVAVAPAPVDRLTRLARGRAVILEFAAGRQVELMLARHRFALEHGRDWTLIGAQGQRYVLQPGLNSVGRSRENTVIVDDTLRNVSRTHLLAEVVGPDRIALTDLSSGGTFVTPEAIAR